MFTRYSNIEVPKNYSGNRFKNTPIEETPMKIHKSEFQSEPKTSVSPTYNDWLYTNRSSSIEQNTNTPLTEDRDLNSERTVENIIEISDNNDQVLSNQENDIITNEVFNDCEATTKKYDFSRIADYLKDIKADDLLLIILIIFLASDRATTNNETIILLALLLTL